MDEHSATTSTKKHQDMKEIDETDEIIEVSETLVKDPHLKESKLRKHIVPNERTTFDSGEYYKKKDIEKKMGDEATDELYKQAIIMEHKIGRTDKKKKHIDKTNLKPVGPPHPEIRFRQCRVLHESRRHAEPEDGRRNKNTRVRQVP